MSIIIVLISAYFELEMWKLEKESECGIKFHAEKVLSQTVVES